MTEEEQLKELIRKGFETINQHIEAGATPKIRAERAKYLYDVFTGKEPLGNEEYDTTYEAKV